jgi:dUTP pyrophosphatase
MDGLNITATAPLVGVAEIEAAARHIFPPSEKPTLCFQLQHPLAKLPTRANPGDAGLDLYACSEKPFGQNMVEYDTGVAVAIPHGYVGLVFPRSSITGTCLRLANCVGVIDSGYRDTIRLRFDFASHNHDSDRSYNVGERIGQLVIVPCMLLEPQQVEKLPETARGTGGFGSTGA